MASNIIDDLRKFVKTQLKKKGILRPYFTFAPDGGIYMLTAENNFVYGDFESWIVERGVEWEDMQQAKANSMLNSERVAEAELRYSLSLEQRIDQDKAKNAAYKRGFLEYCWRCMNSYQQGQSAAQQPSPTKAA